MKPVREILVKDLKVGMLIQQPDLKLQKIQNIDMGWYVDSSLITCSNGEWTCLSNKATVFVGEI